MSENIKTPKDYRDLENLDGEAGMTREELDELHKKIRKDGRAPELDPALLDQHYVDNEWRLK